MLLGVDGLVIEKDFSEGVDASAVAASVSSLLSSMSGTMQKLGNSLFNRYLISCTEGGALIIKVTDTTFLSVLMAKNSNTGMIIVELKEVARELQKILKL